MVCDLGEQSIFRANPDYKLVLLDRLSLLDRQRLQQTDRSEDLYGALVPQANATLQWRAVSCDTALLFMTLAEAGPLPSYTLRRLGSDAKRTINRLVLDGVLQIFLEGQYLCGPHLAATFAPRKSYSGRGRNFDLTISALRYGQELIGLSEEELGNRLYAYGRQPVSPQLRRRLADAAAVASFLGIQENGVLVRSLDYNWTRVPVAPGTRDYWWQWTSISKPRDWTRQTAGYKLYVSPVLRDAPAALQIMLAALLHARGVTGFKVRVGLWGISRPDKIVVYFNELDDLSELADVLRTELSGCASHGVPFTADVSQDGLLSWGADPPPGFIGDGRTTSWRMWVSWRLAEYLISARTAARDGIEPWQYALERLRLAGIDTDTWVPTDRMWQIALDSA